MESVLREGFYQNCAVTVRFRFALDKAERSVPELLDRCGVRFLARQEASHRYLLLGQVVPASSKISLNSGIIHDASRFGRIHGGTDCPRDPGAAWRILRLQCNATAIHLARAGARCYMQDSTDFRRCEQSEPPSRTIPRKETRRWQWC